MALVVPAVFLPNPQAAVLAQRDRQRDAAEQEARNLEETARRLEEGATTPDARTQTAEELRRLADDQVWFDFAALCEGPRAVADYIEIARSFQTVFVSAVPQFDTSQRREDAAKRFIHLVDEFYDRNVNLVLSAEAEPLALYRGERHRHEFERTVSRLIEMQSREYLAREHKP